ncbi:MAG: HD domain-containing protein [Syntrophorhabdaceae bacterium]|nr:HD domain-containing protein [Syntrophorhabdaceae bacterium]
MQKKKFVKDIKEGELVRELFLVAGKAQLTSNTGKAYLSVQLRDRTGTIEARVWDRAEEIGKRFQRDDVVEVSGSAISYQGRVQLKIHDVRLYEGPKELSDYLPASRKEVEQLWGLLRGYVEDVKDTDYKRLLSAVFLDPGAAEMAGCFRRAPGGKTMHHDYVGGLLEHTVSVVGVCRFLSSHYEGVNADLLMTGALLHDLGKVKELSYEGSFDYTDEGRLLGHIYIGAEFVDKVCNSLSGFSSEKAMLVKHMILSHHGELEYGSPKRPKTIEAVLLHFAENMDAKVTAFSDAIEDIPKGARWTDYQRMFERYLFSGKFFCGEHAKAPSEQGKE